ncbi:Protein of unknown function, partial [Gryllus bimaculatus]
KGIFDLCNLNVNEHNTRYPQLGSPLRLCFQTVLPDLPAFNRVSDPASDPTSDAASDPASDPASHPASDPASPPVSDPSSDSASDFAYGPAFEGARTGAAPAWVERQAGCVIAGHDLVRICRFLMLDLARVTQKNSMGFHDHLQLNSNGGITISLVEMSKINEEEWFDFVGIMWILHQSRQWLVVHEWGRERNGVWDLRHDPTFLKSGFTPCAGAACTDPEIRKRARVGSVLNETLNSSALIYEIMGQGLVEFVPMYYHTAGSTPPAIDVASASMEKASVWVLRPKGPLRQTGPNVRPPLPALLLGGGQLFRHIIHQEMAKLDTLEELAGSNKIVMSLPIAHMALFQEPLLSTQWTPRAITYDDLPLIYQEKQEFVLIATDGDLDQVQALDFSWEMCYPLRKAFHISTKFFLLKRNWPWAPKMNELFGNLLATGILHHWVDTFGVVKQLHCEHAVQRVADVRDQCEQEIVGVFSFTHALPHLFLLAGGWAVSVLVFVAECWKSSWHWGRTLGPRSRKCPMRLCTHLLEIPGKLRNVLRRLFDDSPTDLPFGSVTTLQDMRHELSETRSMTDAESVAVFRRPKSKVEKTVMDE